jgi:hypothetical protein
VVRVRDFSLETRSARSVTARAKAACEEGASSLGTLPHVRNTSDDAYETTPSHGQMQQLVALASATGRDSA